MRVHAIHQALRVSYTTVPHFDLLGGSISREAQRQHDTSAVSESSLETSKYLQVEGMYMYVHFAQRIYPQR